MSIKNARITLPLATRLILLISIAVAAVMLSVGYYLNLLAESTLIKEIEIRQQSNLNFAANALETQKQHIKHTSEVIAQNPQIAKALNLQINRGVSQSLNRLMSSYPYINYLLVVDKEQNIFSLNTRNQKGIRINSELLLGKSIRFNPLYIQPNKISTISGSPDIDLYSDIVSNKERKSQWVITPINKHGNFLGWLVVSFAWQNSIQEILEHTALKQPLLGNAIVGALLIDKKNNIIASSQIDLVGSLLLSNDSVIENKLPITFQKLQTTMIILDDRKATYKELHAARNIMIFVIILGVFLMILVLTFGLRFILFNRITLLTDGIKRIERGEIKAIKDDFGSDELAKLGNSFNAMAAKLQHSITLLEEEKLSLDLKVDKRTKELEITRKEALASTKAKSEFLAAMSHEIRTSMNGVLGMAQLLESTPLSLE